VLTPGRHFVRRRTLGARAADRQSVDPDGGQSHPDRDRSSVLAAGSDSGIELQIVAHHRDAREHVGAVADKGRALDRPGHLAVFDQVGLAGREHELAVGDIDLVRRRSSPRSVRAGRT
jgi:hypothetical protein